MMLVYIRLLFFLYFFYNCLSSLLGSVYSLNKYLGLFITKALAGYNGFNKPISIKGRLWCIPVKQFKWRHPYTIMGERKLRVVHYRQ